MEAFPAIRDYISQLGEDRLMDTRLLMEASTDEVELELGDDDLVLV